MLGARGAAPLAVALVAAAFLVAVVARVPPAVHDPLWLDEVVSARIVAEPSLGGALRRVRQTESSPPAWHVVNWAAWRAVGRPSHLERLRLLSVLFGGALAALVAAYSLSLGLSLPAAGIAALLVTLGSNVVAHGAELRPYALLALLALLFALALEGAARRPTPLRLVALALVVAVGCLTHYFFLFTLGTGFAWVLLRSQAPRRVAAALVLGAAPTLLWLPAFLHQYDHNLYAYNGAFSTRAVAYSYSRILGVCRELGGLAALGRILVALFVLAGAVRLVRRRETELAGLLTVVPVALAASFWLLGPKIFNERNLLIVAPFAAVSVGRAVESLPRRAQALAGAAVLGATALSLWHFEVDFGRSQYDRIAQTLVARGWQPRDTIAQFGPAPLGLSEPVGWYLPGRPQLVRARSDCGRLFVVAYDDGRGRRWIAGRSRPETWRRFPAYDHTPRGPRAKTPVVVALVPGGRAAARDSAAHGARLLRPAGAARCP